MNDRNVHITEVGPRDGLQNEARAVPAAAKLAMIRALADAGLRQIEATSFVHPSAIAQLADAEEVAQGLSAIPGPIYSALVPNERGLDRALATDIPRLAVFTAASDEFAQRNIRMSVRESLEVFRRVIPRALDAGRTVRAYLSTAFVCPFAGNIEPRWTADLIRELLELGADEVAVSDTVGAAAPRDIARVLEFALAAHAPNALALHLHDTYGTAIANVAVGLEMGVRRFDSAIGGLGGCPYAPGASGNLATEDLVYFLGRMGYQCGADPDRLIDAALLAGKAVGRTPASHLFIRAQARLSAT